MHKKYNYFYKITNNINGHFYFGVHSTNNLDDGYMGSGKRLHIAYKKYGIENFSKEILKFFDTAKEAYEYEAEVVNESLVKDDTCYNIQQGGKSISLSGFITVKTKNSSEYFVIPVEEYCKHQNKYYTVWNGRHHSTESRQKISKSMTKENTKSMRRWMNKDGCVKYVLKTKIDEYLINGWNFGRPGYKPVKNGQGKPVII